MSLVYCQGRLSTTWASMQLGKYKLLKRIAAGGMAEIWLARQEGLQGFEKLVVIKRILSQLARDVSFIQMFLDEARLAARLSHPNIVQIYDLGEADGVYFISMEHIHGENLRQVLRRTKATGKTGLPVHIAARIMSQACEALYYAHTLTDIEGQPLGIVHRDVSPQNLLVSYQGQLKVVDFGIAKAATQSQQTRAGIIKGKYSYMSPEQCRAKPLDSRSDQFALGILLWELLTGRFLFHRDNELLTMRAVCKEPILSPLEIRPDIPKALEKIIMRALDRDVDARFPDCHAMQMELERFLQREGALVSPVEVAAFMRGLFPDRLQAWREVLDQAQQAGDLDSGILKSRSDLFPAPSEPSASKKSLDEEGSDAKESPPKDIAKDVTAMGPQDAAAPGPKNAPPPSAERKAPSGQARTPPPIPERKAPSGRARTSPPSAKGAVPVGPRDETATISRTDAPLEPKDETATISRTDAPVEPRDETATISRATPPKRSARKEASRAGQSRSSPKDAPRTEIVHEDSVLPRRQPQKGTSRRSYMVVILTGVGTALATLAVILLLVMSGSGSRDEQADGLYPMGQTDFAHMKQLPRAEEEAAAAKKPEEQGLTTEAGGVEENDIVSDDQDHEDLDPPMEDAASKDSSPEDEDAAVIDSKALAQVSEEESEARAEPAKEARQTSPSRTSRRTSKKTRREPPQREPRAPKQRTSPPPTEPGFLSLNARPWCHARLAGGKDLGTTPLANVEVPAGRHRLLCRHPEFGEQTVDLSVSPGEEVRRSISFMGELRFRVRPWARVTLDGDDLGTTPFPSRTLPAGTYTVILENDQLGTRRTERIRVRAGETTTLDVNMFE